MRKFIQLLAWQSGSKSRAQRDRQGPRLDYSPHPPFWKLWHLAELCCLPLRPEKGARPPCTAWLHSAGVVLNMAADPCIAVCGQQHRVLKCAVNLCLIKTVLSCWGTQHKKNDREPLLYSAAAPGSKHGHVRLESADDVTASSFVLDAVSAGWPHWLRIQRVEVSPSIAAPYRSQTHHPR